MDAGKWIYGLSGDFLRMNFIMACLNDNGNSLIDGRIKFRWEKNDSKNKNLY